MRILKHFRFVSTFLIASAAVAATALVPLVASAQDGTGNGNGQDVGCPPTMVEPGLVVLPMDCTRDLINAVFPSPSAALPAVPDSVQISFSAIGLEPTASYLKVFDMTGNQVDAGDSTVISGTENDLMLVHLDPTLPEGVYQVTWQAATNDGYQITSDYQFAIGPQPTGEEEAPASE